MRLTTWLGDHKLTAMYSGDTVLDPEIWGSSSWARALGRFVGNFMASSKDAPVYWLLLTGTHRTYRFLPTFFKEYYPRSQIETPPALKEKLDALVRLKFADEYDVTSGVVRLKEATPVNADRLDLIATGLDNADAQFFAARNPGYANGDYLACLTDLSPENRTRLGKRLLNEFGAE